MILTQGIDVFGEEVRAYIQDYFSGISPRAVDNYMRRNCLSASMRTYVAHADSTGEVV
jgi:hypothetical protein